MDEKPARAWLYYFIGLLALIGVALVMIGSGTARAQEQQRLCAPIDAITLQFQERFKEMPVWGAQSAQGVRILILQSPGGKTYSIFQLDASGIACLIDSGEKAVVFSEPGKGV